MKRITNNIYSSDYYDSHFVSFSSLSTSIFQFSITMDEKFIFSLFFWHHCSHDFFTLNFSIIMISSIKKPMNYPFKPQANYQRIILDNIEDDDIINCLALICLSFFSSSIYQKKKQQLGGWVLTQQI